MPSTLDTDLQALVSPHFPKLPAHGPWANCLPNAASHTGRTALRSEIPNLVKLADKALKEALPETAANILVLTLYCDPVKARRDIGGSGVLRCSRYDFDVGLLSRTVEFMLPQVKSFQAPEGIIDYLNSIENLLKIARKYRHLNHSLQTFITRNELEVVKSLIALVDTFFMVKNGGNSPYPDDLNSFTKEDLAEGASYIVHLFDRAIGVSDRSFVLINETGLERGLYHKILIKASKLRQFTEAEILVDAFEYSANLKRKKVIIAPPSAELEKSIRLGYIMSEQARQPMKVERIAAMRRGDPSIFAIADQLYQSHGQYLVKVREKPIRRYVFELIDHPTFRGIFSHEGLTVEERIYMEGVLESELVTWDVVKDFELRPSITFFDLLKVYRLFMFLARLATNHLHDTLVTDPKIAYRSLVPVFEKPKLQRLLSWAVPQEKVGPILDLISWRCGAAGVIDIQYKTVLDGGRTYMIPLNITGTANWYRNFAYTEKRRLIEDAQEDGASRDLEDALTAASPFVRREYETKLRKQKIEVDVLCRFGDYLFIFECKHALLPCNAFELRTSYKHMQTAAAQLTKIVTLLSDPEAELELYRRLNWKVGPAVEIVTCIVSCNGMFPGLTIDGHPVRKLAELINMIKTGVVKIVSAEVTEDEQGLDVRTNTVVERNLWGADELSPAFLQSYLTEDLQLFEAMIEVERTQWVDDWQLSFSTFALDLQSVQDAMCQPRRQLTR